MISSFHHEVHENCAVLGYYAVSSGNFLPTFRDNPISPILKGQMEFLTLEDGTDGNIMHKAAVMPTDMEEEPVANYCITVNYLLRKEL
jgi:hypothetical protein